MFNHISLGDFHPVLVHLPIALVIIAFCSDFLGWIWNSRRNSFLTIGHWFFLFAAILIIPTAFTGWFAEGFYSPNDPDVERHQNMALFTGTFVFIYGLFRAYILTTQKQFSIYLYLFISLIAITLISITGELGGIVVRGKGILLDTIREAGSPLPYDRVKPND